MNVLDGICAEYRQRHGVLPPLDLHLLTACGMPIEERGVAARTGGHILRVDGHPLQAVHSEVQRVTQGVIGGDATLSGQAAAGGALTATAWTAAVPPALQMDPAAAFAQRLVAYQRQPF
jgi:hypothetical protein